MKTGYDHTAAYNVPVPNNMGMVRYIMAFIVVLAHFSELSSSDCFPWANSYLSVGGFFILSGFIIYDVYLKNPSFRYFMRRRCLRLLPPYVATVVFFALLFAAVSRLTAAEYFSSSDFWKYLVANLSFLNFLQPTLPGVFEEMPVQAVNGSLWTMKVEWCLYLTVPLTVWFIAKYRRRPAVIFLMLYIFASAYQCFFLYLNQQTGLIIYRIIGRQFMGQLNYFYGGVLIFYYFDFFMRHRHLLAAVSAVMIALFFPIIYFRLTLLPICLACVVIWLSFTGKWGHKEFYRTNISYAIYICHMPIMQLIFWTGMFQRCGMWITLAAVLAAVIMFSLALCFFVEKPVRRHFICRQTQKFKTCSDS